MRVSLRSNVNGTRSAPKLSSSRKITQNTFLVVFKRVKLNDVYVSRNFVKLLSFDNFKKFILSFVTCEQFVSLMWYCKDSNNWVILSNFCQNLIPHRNIFFCWNFVQNLKYFSMRKYFLNSTLNLNGKIYLALYLNRIFRSTKPNFILRFPFLFLSLI